MRPPRPWGIVGNPENRRITEFQQALVRRGHEPATVLSYHDLLAGKSSFEQLPPGAVVRFDSPGENFAVEKLLLAAGTEPAAREGAFHLTPQQLQALDEDRGHIVAPRQWYLGYLQVLSQWGIVAQENQLWTTNRAALEVQFDKPLCQQRSAAAGLPIPPPLGLLAGWDDLWERLSGTPHNRVFVKLANSSSASGVVAIDVLRGRVTATTSVEMVSDSRGTRLYNSLKLRRYTSLAEVSLLIDTLAAHRIWGEAWLPKATLNRRVCDLRLLVIAGEPCHAVVRTSRTPLTNLHLGNRRGVLDDLWERVSDTQRTALSDTYRRCAELFPNSLHLGLDILFTPGFRQHYLLEVNAFGDLLPRVTHRGLGTYDAQIEAIENGWHPAASPREQHLAPQLGAFSGNDTIDTASQ